ncbi:MAG: FAD-binding oxidoreductase [Candidatus Dormibacteraeota bacterium]|nr:FAD-binding oxidoreductase [Candidatus Dormibacteraeota bacterium]
MTDQPFWQRPPLVERSPPPERVDVLVVGGGITGVSLLRRLGERGVKAALIERSRLAYGASGRNAGFLLEGTTANYAEAVRTHGRELTREVWQLTGENHRRLAEALASRAGYRRLGSRTLAASASEEAQLAESAELMSEDGWPVTLTARSIVNPRDGELNPADAVGALASDCAPGSIFEEVELTDLEQPPIAAAEVILATNAFTSQLLASIPIAPVRAQMLATAPFATNVADRPTYSDHGYQYWRQLPTGEVLAGGYRDRAVAEEVGYELATTAVIQEHLDRHLAALGVTAPVTHRWAGTMGFTPDALPLVGRLLPGLSICAGYTGHGMAFAHLCARLLVDNLLGGPPPPKWLDPGRFEE